MKKCNKGEKYKTFVKEIFYLTDHRDRLNPNLENDYERSGCHNILNERLSESGNELYIEFLERFFDNNNYYFEYGNEELGYYICWRVIEIVHKRKQ